MRPRPQASRKELPNLPRCGRSSSLTQSLAGGIWAKNHWETYPEELHSWKRGAKNIAVPAHSLLRYFCGKTESFAVMMIDLDTLQERGANRCRF